MGFKNSGDKSTGGLGQGHSKCGQGWEGVRQCQGLCLGVAPTGPGQSGEHGAEPRKLPGTQWPPEGSSHLAWRSTGYRLRDADGSSLLGPSPVAAIQRHLPNSSVILEPACQVGGLTPSHRREKRPRDKVPARSALKALENGLGSPQLPGRPQLPPPAAPHFTPPHSAAAWAPGMPSRTLS